MGTEVWEKAKSYLLAYAVKERAPLLGFSIPYKPSEVSMMLLDASDEQLEEWAKAYDDVQITRTS